MWNEKSSSSPISATGEATAILADLGDRGGDGDDEKRYPE